MQRKITQATIANVLLLLLFRFCTYFSFQILQFCWWGAKIFLHPGTGYLIVATLLSIMKGLACQWELILLETMRLVSLNQNQHEQFWKFETTSSIYFHTIY